MQDKVSIISRMVVRLMALFSSLLAFLLIFQNFYGEHKFWNLQKKTKVTLKQFFGQGKKAIDRIKMMIQDINYLHSCL